MGTETTNELAAALRRAEIAEQKQKRLEGLLVEEEARSQRAEKKLQDWFMGQALLGLVTGETRTESSAQAVAERAYRIALACMRVRQQPR